ncbi:MULTISPECIES: EAL domain-containing protein [unclassified Pseudoxanthomonas]|uniref:putative bifunctional diguanylate cyclase/phosphodiesterase n=1 Tax=unclassified Pseudoxanthomonas TaxID=2645906 RepID=UPI0008ED611E|nr:MULTISPECIES: EAL domain-containing protein [unclassified Pseudoxanthomonas]PPJ42116.1 PAS domain S-box protein [Pseudoxanthomonas sp. KAs_5_3]SFV28498.1 PAS domain S-box-containing protein/diguanylate cyclase (GGDEF) domain-containing protein [Pseudoxanthomonas sp. YR558]
MDNKDAASVGDPAGTDIDRGLKRLPARVMVLILLSALGALLTAAILETQAGATAYIIGESHWSKAQQRAVHSLYRYASHGDAADLAEARASLQVPLGDRAARLALEQTPVDVAAARAGFLQGGNAPGNLDRLIRMYRGLSGAPYFRDSVRLWREAEVEILQLVRLADELEAQQAARSLDADEVLAYQRELTAIDARLRPREIAFSRSLADGADFMRHVLLALSALAFLVLCAYALHVMRKTLRRVRETESEFRMAFHQSAVGMLKLDRDGRFTQANEALAQILGRALQEIRALRLHDVLHADDVRLDAKGGIDWDRLLEPGERRLVRQDGEVRWVRWTASVVAANAQSDDRVFVLVEDVSDAHELACEIAHQASHDELTGLINRREIARRLGCALGQARGCAGRHTLCYIDLDQFKLVNDTCGHEAGDRFLCHFASRVAAQLRRDDWLGRLGGDEFAILLHDTTLEEAEAAMARIHATLAEASFQWNGRAFGLNCSIGVAEINDAAVDVDWLLRAADAACYMAKEEGRNRIRCYRDSDPSLSRRRHELEWVAHTQLAIAEDRLLLYAQQIVALDGGDRFQYEVLVRLRDREGRVHAPGVFLPAMERYGQGMAVDRAVIDALCRHFARHPAELARVDLCHVNVSAQSIADPAFLDHVNLLLDQHPGVAQRLCFEITETAVIANLDDACRFIDGMRARGCCIALDDFGSGLSSFGYLKRLAVDILKIDGAFIRDLAKGESDLALVRSMSQMGQALGKVTIAEWVESEAVMAQLREVGIGYVQGYAVHVPCPLADLARVDEAVAEPA